MGSALTGITPQAQAYVAVTGAGITPIGSACQLESASAGVVGPPSAWRLLGYQTQRVIAGMKAFTVLSVSSSRLLVAWWLDEQRSPVGGEPAAARGRSPRAASSWAEGRRA
jgi:hypothetical protein